jgi:hypothetical protein
MLPGTIWTTASSGTVSFSSTSRITRNELERFRKEADKLSDEVITAIRAEPLSDR